MAELLARPVMWPVMDDDPGVGADEVNALFVSALQCSDEPSPGQVRQAVAAVMAVLGGAGCAGRAAQEFGDHPETAVIRMRWARLAAGVAFAGAAGVVLV